MQMGSKEYCILIVDDVPQNIKVLNEILKDKYKISAATNGPKALQISGSENPPDLIILDIMMPEMDGYEVLAKLKSKDRTKDIPVIFLTAESETVDMERGHEAGAVGFLTKPVSPSVFLETVANQLKIQKDN
jgi:putative two-component system response regulator